MMVLVPISMGESLFELGIYIASCSHSYTMTISDEFLLKMKLTKY